MDQQQLKRGLTCSVDSIGLKIMKQKGYELGQGLGVNSQGSVDPVFSQMKKDRKGVGMPNVNLTSETVLPSGIHSWFPGIHEAGDDGDLTWNWTLWPQFQPGTDMSHSEQEEEEENVDTLVSKAFSTLNQMILSPTDNSAIGKSIIDMETQTEFCPAELLSELLNFKNYLDGLSRQHLIEARIRSNQYEDLQKGIFMNRAAMKMANVNCLFDNLLSSAAPANKVLHFADICAGPGGFSEYLIWRRLNTPIENCGEEIKFTKNEINVRGYGMTLRGDCDFKLHEFLAGMVDAFLPFYGADQTGDITNWENLAAFSNFISQNTHGYGVHLVMADGGFDVSGHNNLQEVLSKRIYICQFLCALTILRPGGIFISKLFDVFTQFSADLIYLISHVFQEVYLVKPVTSRPANSERYLLCKGLISKNKKMVGCPPCPTSINSASKVKPQNAVKTAYKLPGSGRKPSKPTDLSKNIDDTNLSQQLNCTNSAVSSTNSHSSPSAVNLLIQHFLHVNTQLDELKHDPGSNGAEAKDVLRLVKPNCVQGNSRFMKFLFESNKRIAENQCLYLSKLLNFAKDSSLVEERKKDIKEACLKKWKIPNVPREPIPWPLWSSNYVSTLHNVIGGSSGKSFSLSWLPADLVRPEKVPEFSANDLRRWKLSAYPILGIPCGSPYFSQQDGKSLPMTIFSSGSNSILNSIEFTYDGKTWEKMIDKCPNFNLRLPAGSIVWGQITYEYNLKVNRRNNALTILDVAFIYGRDLRLMSYRERMLQARKMANIVNFACQKQSHIIVPDLIRLGELQDFMDSFQLYKCKDTSSPLPMMPTREGFACIPTTLFLVHHLADPWIEVKNDQNGYIYSNCISNQSVSNLTPDAILPYSKVSFYKLPWVSDYQNGCIDARKLASEALHYDF